MDRKISRLNQRIAFQKNVQGFDEYKNQVNSWQTVYECAAYASTYTQNESTDNAVTAKEVDVTFEVRRCSELNDLDTTGWRIWFDGHVYNIESVDPMNYTGGTIRIRCSLERPVSSAR